MTQTLVPSWVGERLNQCMSEPCPRPARVTLRHRSVGRILVGSCRRNASVLPADGVSGLRPPS